MNIKIISQIVAGIFALATTWLTVAYAKQSSVDREKTESISKLAQRVKALESRPPSQEAQLSQHYLKIVAIDTGNLADAHPAARVVANVNGQPYSYPSEAIWSDAREGMPGESFPLPADPSEYVLRFSAFYRNDAGKIEQLTSSDSVRIAVSALPLMNTFTLHLLDEGFSRGGPGRLVIHYEVR